MKNCSLTKPRPLIVGCAFAAILFLRNRRPAGGRTQRLTPRKNGMLSSLSPPVSRPQYFFATAGLMTFIGRFYTPASSFSPSFFRKSQAEREGMLPQPPPVAGAVVVEYAGGREGALWRRDSTYPVRGGRREDIRPRSASPPSSSPLVTHPRASQTHPAAHYIRTPAQVELPTGLARHMFMEPQLVAS